MTAGQVARITYRAMRARRYSRTQAREAARLVAGRFDPARHGNMSVQRVRNGAALFTMFVGLAEAAAFEDYRASHPAVDVALRRDGR
jgi:hypothetical protein